MPKPAVVLLSGGLDSTTVLAIARWRDSFLMPSASATDSAMSSNWKLPNGWLTWRASAAM